MNRFRLVQTLIVSFLLASTSGLTYGQIIWDGGNGDWNDPSGKWNGALTAEEAFGRTNGFEVGSGEISDVVDITSGNVVYDPNVYGDFRFKGTAENPVGTLNLSGGARLSMDSSVAVDGNWTQFDGVALNLDNATLQRTKSGDANSGGAFIIGSWRSYDNQVININLVNDSVIDNDGQLWFGAWDDNAPGLTVNMTIDNGRLDLKGGFDVNLGPNFADADLVFIHGSQGYDPANGGGVPKNESYSINFVGPGSIKVGDSGILSAYQDEFGDYNDTDFNQVSYQDLWNQGILQAHGFSGRKGANFNGFFSVDGQIGDDAYVLNSNVTTPQPIVWDGGDGAWNDPGGKWNGGQTAQAVLGRTNGMEIGSGEIGFTVEINGGNVTYDPDAFGDFRFKSGGTLNLAGGATFTMNSDSTGAVDGYWTEFDGDAINIDNATFSRTRSGESFSGGALILGSWRSYDDQVIEIDITNGGRLENDGQVWFGAWGDNAVGLQVLMTIDDGHLDLTGGNNYDLLGDGGEFGGPGNADLIFINGNTGLEPKGETYAINFVGPGSITVDESGIINPVDSDGNNNALSYGDTLTTLLSYEDLWDRGILQANGMSGLDGANFSEFFTTMGSVGANDYTLTSLLGNFNPLDCNGDGVVDTADLECVTTPDLLAATLEELNLPLADLNTNGVVDFPDFLTLSNNFGQNVGEAGYLKGDIDLNQTVAFGDFVILADNFGRTSAAAAAVPEPASAALLSLAAVLLGVARRRRR